MSAKVSIILPNYNHSHYIKRSLDGIFSQSLKPYEVIVIDDCSTDNSMQILSDYENKYQNLRVFKNLKNMGTAKSVNFGIEKAKGEYLAFCSADDYIKSNFTEVLVGYLETNKNLALCTSDFCTFQDEDIEKTKKRVLIRSKKKVIIQPIELNKMIRNKLFWIPTNTSMYRRKYLNKFSGLDDSLKWMSDWFLNYQIAFNYPVAYVPEALTGFRMIESSYSHSIKNKKEAFDGLFDLLKVQPKSFQNFFKKSGILYQQGKKAICYLISQPNKWNYLPPVLKNTLKFKLEKFKDV
jgi:glycosyltransferase involved in cell wall biosynthesis